MPRPKKPPKDTETAEASAYLSGLFREFHEQTHKYHSLTGQLLSLEAQIELVEKTLCLTRDHLAMMIGKTDSATPRDWNEVLRGVRFVGVRLADACKVLLQEHQRLTPKEIVGGLNLGMFRFRTSSPLREIHAALLRQSFAERSGESYVWVGTTEHQLPLRMRVVKGAMLTQRPGAEAGSKAKIAK
jgi:hypothetical protein